MTKYTLPSLGGAGVGDVDDVRVADLRRGARLAAEALDEVGHPAVARVQDLERDPLADLDVLGEVDLAHAALADQLDRPVAAVDLHRRSDRARPRRDPAPGRARRQRRSASLAVPPAGSRRSLALRRSLPSSPRSVARRPIEPGLADRRHRRRRAPSIETLSDFSIIWRSSSVGGSVSARVRTRASSSCALAALADDVLGEQLLEERRHPRAVGGRRVLREPRLQRHRASRRSPRSGLPCLLASALHADRVELDRARAARACSGASPRGSSRASADPAAGPCPAGTAGGR